jgi:peptidyl-prolyl cis-trans isomerase D
MSVIQKIRDKGAWIMFGLIAIALISFVLQDRAFGGGRGGVFTNTTTLGKINGVTIDRTDFENELSLMQKMYGQQAGNREQLIPNVWNQDVERIINQQEYDKLGLVVSDKELSDILFDPQQSPLKREFTDEKTGLFDVEKAKQIMAQVKKSKNADQIQMVQEAYLKPTIEQKLRTKYSDLLQHGIYIPKWLVEKTQADNNAIASISYVAVPYNTIVDSTIKVSDDEIMDYAKKHHREYDKDDETRGITYVAFDATPSAADSLSTFNQVDALKADFAAAKDEKAYLGKVGTETPFKEGYYSKAKVESGKKDSILKLSAGQTYGPYLDGSNYVIAKLIGIKQWPDSAKVRHILIATTDTKSGQQIKEDTVAKKTADSIQTAIAAGANFEELCKKYSDDPGSKDKGGVYDFFPQGQMVPEFNEFAFDKPVGSKGVVKTDFGYHYIEVLGQKNPQPAYKIAYLAKPIIASSETVSAASTAAAQFSATNKTLEDFQDNAKKINKAGLTANEIKENDSYVGSLGQSRELVRWVYAHDKGDVSEPFEVGDKYVVAIETNISKPGLPDVSVLRPQVESLVRNQKKAKQIIESKFTATTLEAISKNTATPVTKADSLTFTNAFIPGLGMENKVIGAAFNKNLKGKVSDPIAGSSGVYAIRVENIGAKQSTTDALAIKQSLQQQTRSAFYRGGDALRKAATIKDYRSKFY